MVAAEEEEDGISINKFTDKPLISRKSFDLGL